MPTRFCVKKIGKPSSMRIATATIRNIGAKIIKRKRAKNLENILILNLNN